MAEMTEMTETAEVDAPGEKIPMDELKKMFDAAEAQMPGMEAPEGEEPPPEMPPAEMPEGEMAEAEMAEADVDLSPLMESLGATEARAQMLYDSAQQLEKTQGKTAQELADMIADDFDLLMQLEMVAARGDGGAEAPPMPEEMPAEAGAEMMPPEGM
jgi:hypothetical protein|tara:strand:+ start:1600 stop:2070 length:471 start_codon:yes stop_codon:yes gene_type:complete